MIEGLRAEDVTQTISLGSRRVVVEKADEENENEKPLLCAPV
jgi:hypothetical protein